MNNTASIEVKSTSKKHTTRDDRGRFAAECITCGEAKSDPMNEKCDDCNAHDYGQF